MCNGNINVFSVLDGGDVWADVNTLFVDASLDRVGIGTSGPSATLDVNGDAEINGIIECGMTTDTYDKIRVYPSSNYTIGMKSAQTFGFLNDWATTFTMNADADRGWLWRDGNDTDSDGAMSLTTDGRLFVKGIARVGPGTVGGGGILDVLGPGGVQGNLVISRTVDDGVLIRFRRDGTTQGTIEVAGSTVSYNAFTGSHYAWTNQKLKTGMLVTMTGDNKRLEGDDKGEILYGIRPSTEPNDSKILGAYLAKDNQDPSDPDQYQLVMAAGNGEMWIVDNGKNINIGDYLISSHIEGHAMKDAGEYAISYIVARAAEPVDWKHVDKSINNVKHAKISVLFESFIVNHQLYEVTEELNRVKSEINELKRVIAELVKEQALAEK